MIGIDEADAVALGAEFGQDVIFVLTPVDRRVVGCTDKRVGNMPPDQSAAVVSGGAENKDADGQPCVLASSVSVPPDSEKTPELVRSHER